MPGLVLFRSLDAGKRAVNDEGAVESHSVVLDGVSGWSFNALSASLLQW